MQASTIAALDAGPQTAYWRFHDAVAQAQVNAWLKGRHQIIIDISGPASRAAALAASAGHTVLRVSEPGIGIAHGTLASPCRGPDPQGPAPARLPEGTTRGGAGLEHPTRQSRPPKRGVTGVQEVWDAGAPHADNSPETSRGDAAGMIRTVAADGGGLEFLADGCADGVVAEDRTLSRRLAAETVVSEIWRVLRPCGRVLASVDSLTRGMAVLAEQHHWPHLVDLPHADVVLIPWPDGTITRCYGTQQLRELFTASGFEVDWIRPRTVLSASTVSYLLARDPGSFARLVQAEMHASADDSVGAQLVISARKR